MMAAGLSLRLDLALLLCVGRSGSLGLCFLDFLGLPQGAKAFHVTPPRDGLLLDINHRAHALFRRQPLSIDARKALWRFFGRLLVGHRVQFCTSKTRSI